MKDKVNAKLDSLATLEDDWDSYDAEPVDPEQIRRAKLFYEMITTKMPTIIPTIDGSLQFEWSGNGIYIEIPLKEDVCTGEDI